MGCDGDAWLYLQVYVLEIAIVKKLYLCIICCKVNAFEWEVVGKCKRMWLETPFEAITK